jgi:toxin secretion/phage lysis holin
MYILPHVIVAKINIKSSLGLIGSSFTYLFCGDNIAFGVLLILTSVDAFTGLYKAWHNNEIRSRRFRDKIRHFIGYSLVILCFNQALLIADYLKFLVDFVVLYFAAGELISIMENLEEVGVPMPTYVKNKLMDISKRKENRQADI